MNYKEIREKVYNYKTKHKQGFTKAEVKSLLKEYPAVKMERFNDALFGNTCMVIDDDLIMYHCDIEKALICGLENRTLMAHEWD